MALYMTYTCAKPHFFKYNLSLYTHFQPFSLLLLNFLDLSSFSLAFGFFFSGFPLWFFISFLSSPSPGDYFFRYVDSVHLIYDFFVPPHKYEIFFCLGFRLVSFFSCFWWFFSSLGFLHGSSLGFLRFSPISPGYYFFFLGFSYQSFALFMFLPLIMCFLILLTASKWYSSTFQFLQQPVVEVEWICSSVLMFFFHFSLFCWFNIFCSFSIYISVSAATGSGSGMGFSFISIFFSASRWNFFLPWFSLLFSLFIFFCW